MNKFLRSALASAAIAAVAGLGNAALAQTPIANHAPVPAIPPPIASHSDPTAPVPTNPPEQIASPARLHSVAPARMLTEIWSIRTNAPRTSVPTQPD